MTGEGEGETATDEVTTLGSEEIEALSLERIKGKLLLINDYQDIFNKHETPTTFCAEGATEDQIDFRIQELNQILTGNIISSRGTNGLAEAQRLNTDLTHRLDRISFIRIKKRRQSTDDGLTDVEGDLRGDPNHSNKKQVLVKRKRVLKPTDPSAAPITNYFSPPPGKKPIEEDQDPRAELSSMPGVCNFCSAPKADECGVCKAALCERHVQIHSHGQGRPANGMSNKIRKVSFGTADAVADAVAVDESEEEASFIAVTNEIMKEIQSENDAQSITRPEYLLDVS
jgi:hypothetical protein